MNGRNHSVTDAHYSLVARCHDLITTRRLKLIAAIASFVALTVAHTKDADAGGASPAILDPPSPLSSEHRDELRTRLIFVCPHHNKEN